MEVPADVSIYLETAVHMHSLRNCAGEHEAAYIGSSPEEQRPSNCQSTEARETFAHKHCFGFGPA